MSDSTATVSIKICQEGHANALALNKDNTQIAVAGRSILKIYSIDSDSFTEVCNMRSGKNQNLSYSSNDVAWSSLETNLLATAATNGVVSVWDLLKSGRHKQLLVYNEHERTAHTVTFHSTEPHLLISGSQDGTIKCFDLRMDKAVHTYFSNSESVRDVKFNPHSPNIFAAVSENGTVQLWDIKRPDKCHLQFTAHSGPIYTCDWHPNQQWLATGSRDKQIKIWNMEQKPTLEYTIHTIAVVGRVKWRPDRVHHIASCALVVDYSVYIWDVRRPYIPYASFEEHTNVTTGIGWKGNDAHVLLSTSKDSTIFKHSFKDALRPCLSANPQAASFNFKGDLLYSYKVKNVQTSTMTMASAATSAAAAAAATAPSNLGSTMSTATASSLSLTTSTTITNIIAALPLSSTTHSAGNTSIISSSPSTGLSLSHFLSCNRPVKQPTIQDQFHLAKSNLCNYIPKAEVPSLSGVFKLTLIKDLQALRGFAREYILYGKSLEEICEHNAAIALKYERPNIHLLWLIIKNVYSTNENEIIKIVNTSSNNNGHQTIDARFNSTIISSSQNPLPNRILLSINNNNNNINNNINNDGGIETNGLLQKIVNMGIITEGAAVTINNGNQNNQLILNINTNSPKENDMGNDLNQQKKIVNIDMIANIEINNLSQDNLINYNNTNNNTADSLKLNELKHSKSNNNNTIPIVPTTVVTVAANAIGILNKHNNINNNEHCDDYVFDETELSVENLDIKSLRNGFLYIGPHDMITKNGGGGGGGNNNSNNHHHNNNNNGNWLLPINTIIGHDLQSQDSSQQQQTLLLKNNNINNCNNQQIGSPPIRQPPPPAPPASPTIEQPHLLKILSMDWNKCQTKWKPHNIISECLTLQTETGDVQTAVCVLIAMGDKRCQLQIDEMICESWLLSYIELLYRHQCWNEATEIINKSWIRSVCELNQQSTSVHTNCGECNKPLINTVGWYCQKCKSAQSSKCSVCNKVVKGLYAWCQGCSHGGHLDHLKRWFSNHSKCPRCGHLCEYE